MRGTSPALASPPHAAASGSSRSAASRSTSHHPRGTHIRPLLQLPRGSLQSLHALLQLGDELLLLAQRKLQRGGAIAFDLQKRLHTCQLGFHVYYVGFPRERYVIGFFPGGWTLREGGRRAARRPAVM